VVTGLPVAQTVTVNSPSRVLICTCLRSHLLTPPAAVPDNIKTSPVYQVHHIRVGRLLLKVVPGITGPAKRHNPPGSDFQGAYRRRHDRVFD